MQEMKESGIEWIGKIPSSWNLKRIQFCLKEINEKNIPIKTEQVLSLVRDKGVMLYEDKGNQGNKAKEDVTQYKIAYPNTLIVNSMNILIGSVGISNYMGCVSPVYYVFQETKESNLRYINYIFNTREFQKELRKYANGILEIRLRVSATDIFKRKIPLPDKDTQIAIADFLDKKCEEIDMLSNDISVQIETLEEYKKAVITEVVSRGLEINTDIKDSGEFIGDIPANWKVCKVKHIAELITDGAHITPDISREEYKFLSVTDMDDYGNLDFNNCLQITEEQYKYFVKTGCKPQKNDVLISKDGTIGKTTVIDSDEDFVIASSLVIIRPNIEKIDPYYLKYSLMSEFVQEQLKSLLAGSALKRVSVGKNANLKFIYTKKIEEQKALVAFLDMKCVEINKDIEDKKFQLEILEQYKKSLIFEYVTGKKEVPINGQANAN